MKKYSLALILLIGLACAPAQADTLFIALDFPTLTGSPGSVLQFFGTITNTTGSTVFLNADNLNLTGLGVGAIDDSPFFTNAPLSLAAGLSTLDIGLFNVTIPSVFATGNYDGTFQILGGSDAEAQDVVGTAFFTVQVQPAGVPEPSSGVLLSSALFLLLFTKRIISARLTPLTPDEKIRPDWRVTL